MRESFPSIPFDIVTSSTSGGGDVINYCAGSGSDICRLNLKIGKDTAIEGKIDRESELSKPPPPPVANPSVTSATTSSKERSLDRDKENVISDTNDTQGHVGNLSSSSVSATAASTNPTATATSNSGATATSPSVYTVAPFPGELEELQNILHFPEEVALRLTDTEYQLFYQVRE
jgi:hypothetical protein